MTSAWRSPRPASECRKPRASRHDRIAAEADVAIGRRQRHHLVVALSRHTWGRNDVLVQALLLVCLLNLTACSATPDEFVDRKKLASCGSFEVTSIPFATPKQAKACMERAKGSRAGAELVVTSSTVEGDPIRRYFRYEPGDDALVVWEDATSDRFRGRTSWNWYECEDVRSLDRWFEGACTSRTL